MNPSRETTGAEACETLSHAYGQFADAWEAQELANLFTPDGVFDRLGRKICGRAAIREFIAGRPRDMWQRHRGSNFQFEIAADGLSAKGQLDLALERGRVGETEVMEVVRARYFDRFVLTDEGWRFSLREVVLVA